MNKKTEGKDREIRAAVSIPLYWKFKAYMAKNKITNTAAAIDQLLKKQEA